jgi:hypothetical protein
MSIKTAFVLILTILGVMISLDVSANQVVKSKPCDVIEVLKTLHEELRITGKQIPDMGYGDKNIHNTFMAVAIICNGSNGDINHQEPVGKYGEARYGAGLFSLTPATATKHNGRNITAADLKRQGSFALALPVIEDKMKGNAGNPQGFLSSWYCGKGTCPLAGYVLGRATGMVEYHLATN